jgi:hypothetical protein
MSAALGRPAVRWKHSGPPSSYKPGDLRVDDPRPTGITEATAAAARTVVQARAAADTDRVLTMLGLAVAS